jgi:outer membrane lipoprotein-sorting protein
MRKISVHSQRSSDRSKAASRNLCSRDSWTVGRGLRTMACGLLLLLNSSVFAQYTGFTPVAGTDAFKKEFAVQSGKITTITSNFTQEKVLSALTEKITSTGTFKFKRANRVRIEYMKPFVYLLVMNGDKILVRDDHKESRVNVRSNKMFQQINRIIVDCVQGTILESRDFKTTVFENDKTYLLEMTPVSKTLGDFFQTIVLTVDKKDYSVKSIEMNEPAGDQTVITFTEKKLNVPVPDEVFAL